jgi:transcriptional regulator with XRE-family HTH domain
MSEPALNHLSPVAALRRELSLTLAEMGERVGLSKSQMHEVERSGRASLPVALAIETLSEGRIDAADLNEDVKAARHAVLVTPAEVQNHVG